MKLNRITLRNFGIYVQREFHFESAPLVVIYGANEAGKTTALNGIRQSLFGFRTRTPYLTGRPMSATVSARMADGRELEFTRKKARQDELSGSCDGRKLGPDDLHQYLGSIDLDTYEQLLGFSLNELREGEAMLRNAKLCEALAGGGLGGLTALQHLREELNSSLADLYKLRGSNSQINVVLSQLSDSQRRLREAQIQATDVTQLRHELNEQLRHSEQLKHRYQAIFRERSFTHRKVVVLPKFRQLHALQRQLADTQIPQEIDVSFIAQWSEHSDRELQLVEQQNSLQEQIEQAQSQLLTLGTDDRLIGNETIIESIGHQAKEIPAKRAVLVALENSIAACQRKTQELLLDLGLPEYPERLAECDFSLPQKDRLAALSAEILSVTANQKTWLAKQEAAQESLQVIEEDTESLVPAEELSYLRAQLDKLQQDEQELLRLTSELEATKGSEDTEPHKSLLFCITPAHTLASNLVLPSFDQIEQFRVQESETESTISQLTREQESLQKLIEELTTKSGQEADPSSRSALHVLESLRLQRTQLMDDWFDDLSQPLIALSISPHEQESRLRNLQVIHQSLDEATASVIESAEKIASDLHFRQRLLEAQEKLTLIGVELENLHSRKIDWQQRWQAIWPTSITPTQPAEMLAWRQNYLVWQQLIAQEDKLRHKLHIVRGSARQIRASLLDTWPVAINPQQPVESLVEQLTLWQNTNSQHQQLAKRRLQLESQCRLCEQNLLALDRKSSELYLEYTRWLKTTPLPEKWPLHRATELVQLAERLVSEQLASETAKQELTRLVNEIKQFEDTVDDLAGHFNEVSRPDSPELWATQLFRSLQEIRDSKTRHAQLQVSLQIYNKRFGEVSDELQIVRRRIQALVGLVDSIDAQELPRIMQQVRRAEQLRQEISELRAAIETAAECESLDEFFKELANSDLCQLQLSLEQYDREMTQMDEARAHCDQRIGAIETQIEQMACSSTHIRQQQVLQQLRGDLAELSEQWIVQKLAQELLTRAIDRFTAEHEPALIVHARRFLSQLTGGRYVDLEHDASSSNDFTVLNASGERIQPSRFSTGTREQLYLALRFAFVVHHCENFEPLPVLMDDCFVNFDDARARFALQSLLNWPSTIQRIILTCHHRIVQFIAEVAPSTPVIHLGLDSTISASELVSEQTFVFS
ncbi:MAG: AAA family ATPase [Planctomycetales bacterium]|nr:AAA family ATPase [Planctomycetales bacterium]